MKINSNINMKVIIAIVGPSGSGKTTMANIMAENGIPTIVSYTTRPMRDGETNGKEHWFVSPEQKPNECDMIAYTKFGDYEYWATTSQISDMCTYVIDEKGIEYLLKKLPTNTVLFTVYLDRDLNDRLNSGVDEERCNRDKDRTLIPLDKYDYVIHNNYTLEEFEKKIKEVTYELMK